MYFQGKEASDCAIIGKKWRALVFFRSSPAEALISTEHCSRVSSWTFQNRAISQVINMLAVLENVQISGHHQFVSTEVLQVRLKGRILVTNFSNQNKKGKITPNVLFSMT